MGRVAGWVGAGLFLLFFAAAGILFGSPGAGMSLGANSISLSFESVWDSSSTFRHEKSHPFGPGSVEHAFAVQFPRGSLILEISRDPGRVLRRKMAKTLPDLVAALESEDALLRYCAVQELEALRAEAVPALPQLIAMAERVAEFSHFGLVQTIASWDPPRSKPHLIRALESPKPEVAASAASILAAFGPSAEDAAPALLLRFRKSSAATQVQLAEVLWSITESCDETLPALMAQLDRNTDPGAIAQIVRVLGQFGKCAEPAVPLIVASLKNAPNLLEFRAVRSLASIGARPELCIPALLEIIEAKRKGATDKPVEPILALSGFGTNAVPHLITLFLDAEPEISEAAFRALIRLGPAAAVASESIEPELSTSSEERVALAFEFFASVGKANRSTILKLNELLAHFDRVTRMRAALTLIKVGEITDETVFVLMDASRHTTEQKEFERMLRRIQRERPELAQIIDNAIRRAVPMF